MHHAWKYILSSLRKDYIQWQNISINHDNIDAHLYSMHFLARKIKMKRSNWETIQKTLSICNIYKMKHEWYYISLYWNILDVIYFLRVNFKYYQNYESNEDLQNILLDIKRHEIDFERYANLDLKIQNIQLQWYIILIYYNWRELHIKRYFEKHINCNYLSRCIFIVYFFIWFWRFLLLRKNHISVWISCSISIHKFQIISLLV